MPTCWRSRSGVSNRCKTRSQPIELVAVAIEWRLALLRMGAQRSNTLEDLRHDGGPVPLGGPIEADVDFLDEIRIGAQRSNTLEDLRQHGRSAALGGPVDVRGVQVLREPPQGRKGGVRMHDAAHLGDAGFEHLVGQREQFPRPGSKMAGLSSDGMSCEPSARISETTVPVPALLAKAA